MSYEDEGYNPPVDDTPALDGRTFPLNRVLALAGPYIAIASGGMAAWLSQHFPGLIAHPDRLTASITQGVTFLAGMLVTWALHHKYLHGWQEWEAASAAQAAPHTAYHDPGGFPAWARPVANGEGHHARLPVHPRHRR